MKRLLRNPNYFILGLVLLEFVIFLTNYSPGTFLIGWDNVMPEFNLWLNFKRSLFSIWQGYRGLGLLDGLAHSANLIHAIYIAILSVFLPDSLLRYTYIHLTHLAGGIGFYLLARRLVKSEKAAFLASLFYMLNIGVVQMYFAPLEVFATHFAALPIMAYLILNASEKPNKKHFLLLFFGSLLTTPQGFVPTVFISYAFLVGFFLLFLLLKRKYRTAVIIAVILFVSNAFWALPYVYSGLHAAPIIQQTRINQFASEEIYYRNKAHGGLLDVLSLNGFMISTIEYDHRQNTDVFFMDAWRKHEQNILYSLLYAAVLGIAGIGIWGIIKKRQKAFYPFLGAGLVAFFFLANNTPVFDQINTLIREVFPVIGEALRFPFTKFITLFAFCISLLFAVGLSILFERFKRVALPALTVGAISILFLALPVFTGHFTSPLLRLTVPKEYFSLFAYLNTQDENSRIAIAPLYTFWNWQYRNWGHRGSGFLWYGIKQPITERAFDPWSNFNEQFYNELAYAINTQDNALFEQVIRKYDVHYILLDTYLRNTLSKQPINYDSLETFFNRNPFIKDTKHFGKLTLYETRLATSAVYTLDPSTIQTAQNFDYERQDLLSLETKNYVISDTTKRIIPLFPSLTTEKLQSDVEFNVTEGNNTITFAANKPSPENARAYNLELPSLFSTEFLIPVAVTMEKGSLILTPRYPQISVNNTPIVFSEEPVVLHPKTVTQPTKITFVDIKHSFPTPRTPTYSYLLNNYTNSIKLEDGKHQEILFLDTAAIKRPPVHLNLNADVIRTVTATIPTFDSPLSVRNVIKNNGYDIQNQQNNINPFEKDSFIHVTQNPDAVTFSVKSALSQLVFYKDSLYHQGSYIVFVDAGYTSGLPINFYLDNPYVKRADIETLLAKEKKKNVIIIPRTENYFQGYGFHFTVKSVGTEVAESSIDSISLYPFPAQTLKNIQLTRLENGITKEQKTPIAFTKHNASSYTAHGVRPNEYLVLSEAFDPGWRAYEMANGKPARNASASVAGGWQVVNGVKQLFPFFFGKELKQHVLVNNWENGWMVPRDLKGSTVRLVYAPQYLEYVGFFLLLGTGVAGIYVLFNRQKRG